MAQTLNATLATAQNSMDRHPLVEVISDQWTSAIPFDGQYFNDYTTDETLPEIIMHSSGRITGLYASGESPLNLMFLYTDTNRTTWYSRQINLGGNYTLDGMSLTELANGDIGITWIDTWAGISTSRLRTMVVDEDGDTVTAASTVESWNTNNYWVDSPNVIKISGETTYLLTYAYNDVNAGGGSGEYRLHKRTSSNFTSWNTGEELGIGGLVGYKRLDHPHIVEPVSNTMVLFFDYTDEIRADGAEVVNIYKTESDDNGVTWTSGEQLTNHTSYGFSSLNPTGDVNSSDQITLAYHEENAVLHLDENSAGWCESAGGFCTNTAPTDCHFDPSTRKLYIYNIYTQTGSKTLCGIIVIDVDTWTIEECYSDSTTPAIHDIFGDYHVWYSRNKGDGYYVGIGTCNNPLPAIKAAMVLNYNTDTITNYFFVDYSGTYPGATKNINVDWRGAINPRMGATAIDADTHRMYIYFYAAGSWDNRHWFGYIDLTETADPATGMYSWHEVFYETLGGGQPQLELSIFKGMTIFPDHNYVVFDYGGDIPISNWKGATRIYTLTGGGLVKYYNYDDYSSYPYRGSIHSVYWDGHLYTSFHYESAYGQSDRRGLLDINLATDQMQYITAGWAGGIDDYSLYRKIALGDDRLAITSKWYGTYIYDIGSATWTEYSNDTVPGYTESGSDYFILPDVAYDATNNWLFITNAWAAVYTTHGIYAVSEYGSFNQLKYRTGSWGGSDWTFTAESDLSLYTQDSDVSVGIDNEDITWAVWKKMDTDEYSIMWDKTSPTLNFDDYLVGSVEATWNIDQPNELTFSLGNGHLFDPHNTMSILSMYARRGRKITLRFGELVGSGEYWHNQGTFVIAESNLTYQRGVHPILNVTCFDRTRLWTEGTIAATEYFDDADPETVLDDLLQDHGQLTAGEIDIPAAGAFTNSHKIYYQWVGESLQTMIDDVLDHFGYVANMDMDGKFSVFELDFDASPDHVYGDHTKIIELSPDDSYATYVNRVVVKGEGRYFIEVLYNSEMIREITGTMGWWGCEQYKTVYYAEDQSRICRNPRLVTIEAIGINIFFTRKGGGNAYISSEDPSETYVVVFIESPNLIWIFAAAVVAMVAIGYLALICDNGIRSFCGPFIMALSLAMEVVAYILACEANYAYEIWAQPVGHEKQTFQAEANDTELQNELDGLIITNEIDDPFCYTQAQCQVVANRELEIVMSQRKRLTFTKTAHLQDEITDIITVPHPISQQLMRIMLTNIKRRFTKPDRPGGAGAFLDYIEGWSLGSVT